ncbi:MAG TPA: AMP-binding protein, partial [Myxococcota bacterium]
AHVDNARGALAFIPFSVGSRWLLSLPLGHVGGLAVLFRAVIGGGAIVVPASTDLHESIIAARPTHLSLVAAQLTKIVDDERVLEVLRSSCTDILVGGGPTTPALFARAIAAGLPVRQTWGLTEMGSQVCTSLPQQTSTCGAALPGRFVRTLDDGELVVGGAGRFRGFLGDDDTLVTPFLDVPFSGGGYATGDLGAIDAAGHVVLTGRKGNRFISGGENIQPEIIEAALGGDDAIVIVVPVDDARFGQRPFAFVDGVHADMLRARADERLPRFMHPVGYAPLPDSGGLKPRRRELQALAATLHTSTKEHA